MNNNNENIIYTAGDIEQYLAGKLSPQQMHAMERAALDDPFLAEAIEGYEAVKDKEWNNQLVALREQIEAKGAVAKVIPLHKSKTDWRKLAAAIIILGAGAIVTFVLTRDNSGGEIKPQIAQTVTAAKDSSALPGNETPASVTESLNPTASSAKEEMVAANDNSSKSEAIKLPDRKSVSEEKVDDVKTESLNDQATVSASPVKEITPAQTENKASGSAEKNAEMSEVFKSAKKKTTPNPQYSGVISGNSSSEGLASVKKDQTLNNFFTAQVVGADNAPLPFTNISIKKDNFGTYADIKGMVRLVSTDSLLNVEVKSVGYLPKTISLRSGQPTAKVVLQEDEDAMRDNAVVIDKGKSNIKSRRATLVTDSAVNVEPKDGWENYNTYVANNLDLSEEMLNRNIRGEVELSFDVKANGTISNIRVNKSLGAEYDEAAKRLLLEGPQWKVKKGKKTSASVKVQF